MPHPVTDPQRCLVVIPAHDEAATIGTIVDEVQTVLGATVLVVDDRSSDDTVLRARNAGARVLSLSHQLGAWGATQAGLRYAHRHGFDHVLAMDGDGQHHASSLPILLSELESCGMDVMIGSCEARLSTAKRMAWAYFRFLTGLPVRDFTSGLRVYGPHAVRVLAGPDASLLDYQDIGVLLLLKAQGLRMAEVDARMSPRANGMSRVFSSWPVVAKYMLASTVLCLARLNHTSRDGDSAQ